MNGSATTLPIKALLRAFLEWLEGVSTGTRQPGSPFDLPLDPGALAKAQEAVDQARAKNEDITLFTGDIPAQAIVASLVFSRAGFGADRMAQGELTAAEADSLVEAVGGLAACKLVVVQQELPPAADQAGEGGNRAYVIRA